MEIEPGVELEEIGAAWAEAMVSNDADLIGSFMGDDWVMVSERGISSKEDLLGHIRSGSLTHSRFEAVGRPRIKFYGEAAVLSARVVNTARFGGMVFEADEWTTDVFIKRDGKWLCVLSQITAAINEFKGE